MEEYYKVNVTGTENVCRAALKADVRRIVHVSSWTIYGMGRGWAIGEEVRLEPHNDLLDHQSAGRSAGPTHDPQRPPARCHHPARRRLGGEIG